MFHVLGSSVLKPSRLAISSFQPFRLFALNASKFKKDNHRKVNAADSIVKNEKIKFPHMRVIYDEPDGSKGWKIMNRVEALNFARSKGLDLILVTSKSNPPVCKIELYQSVVATVKEKEKVTKSNEKARVLKEMFMTGGIEKRDFQMKMDKVISFLQKGHPVKVSIIPKRFLKNDRFKDGVRRDRMAGFDETILMLLESLEGLDVAVTEQKIKAAPAKQPISTKATGRPPPPLPKEASSKATSGTRSHDDVWDEMVKVQDNGDSVDDYDYGDDDDDDDDDDGIEKKKTPFPGIRAPVRKEFMINPKSGIIISNKKEKGK